MTTMAQFAAALKDGEFPVTWGNGFANYGLPLPLFAHQIPAYLGAILILLGLPIVLSYNLLMLGAVFGTSLLFYLFLKKHTTPVLALSASILFMVFPYRLINIYIRGALPEMLASLFFPVLLLGIWHLTVKNSSKGGILICLATLLLALTHPMMLVVFALPASIYFLFNLQSKFYLKQIVIAVISIGLGLLIASYYLLPLVLEMKYFYQGAGQSSINSQAFFQLKNFFDPNWYYFYTHPGPRGDFVKLGLPESLLFVTGSVVLLIQLKKNTSKAFKTFWLNNKNLITWWLVSSLSVMLLLKPSLPLYQVIPGLAQLQYPWRFLAVLQFALPLLFIFTLQKISFLQNKLVLLLLVTIFLILRTPQLYGKNYVHYAEDYFYFNQANLHSQNLNTIWSGPTENYPVKNKQAEIVEGLGNIQPLELKNASRQYQIKADTRVRIVDYTFYFPGWVVSANQKPVEIQFQDPNYRGVITYSLDPGEYLVEVDYKLTKIRALSRAISILGLVLTGVWCYILSVKKWRSKVSLDL
jgi:hypothetical protein